MNTHSQGARLLASWIWRLVLLAVAAFMILVISFAGLRRYDWLICRCYGQCVPFLLIAAITIGCGRRRLQWAACAAAALAPFFTWYLLSDSPSPYFTWCTVLWMASAIWFAFEMNKFIRSLAQDTGCDWLVKICKRVGMSLAYLLLVPICAFVVANTVLNGSPLDAIFWNLSIQSLHETPKYTLPFVWNAFIFFKLCCSAVLASQMTIRRQFVSRQSDHQQEPLP